MYSNLLPITTAINPRELGGLTGLNNRKIQMHRLLRTGDLSKMSLKDRQLLKDYGVVKIIDLHIKITKNIQVILDPTGIGKKRALT